MKLIHILLEEEDYRIPLETYGDLKTLLNKINKDQKIQGVLSKGKEVGIDFLVGLIPGGTAAKSGYDLLKGFVNKPDTKKSNTWLDRLDIDDEMSKIVDDTVENGFIQAMFDTISAKPDDEPLEDTFDMNDEMGKYLEKEYKRRTVVGYKENA